jgi:hypothetical protein
MLEVLQNEGMSSRSGIEVIFLAIASVLLPAGALVMLTARSRACE